MRIGIDISQVIFSGTGAATYTSELVQRLVTLDTDDTFVLFGGSLRRRQDLLTFQKSLVKPTKASFPYLPPTLLHYLWNTLHIVPLERLTGPLDLFHSSDATQPKAKCPVVTTVHDLVAWHFPETLDPFQVKVQKMRLHWVKKETAAIIAVSQATKIDLVDLIGIKSDRIHVIYEGVSDRFNLLLKDEHDKIAAVRQKYKLPQMYLFNVGTVQPRKNIKRLITAHKTIKEAPLLAIAGNLGWGDELPQTDTVKRLGLIPNEDLPYLYAGARAFLYPSLYEGFGLPVLEAMACGTPVLTSNTSSLAEIAGDAAVLVDPHDEASVAEGIDTILQLSDVAYQTLQQKGIDRAKQFDWQKTAAQTLEVYRQVANMKRTI